MPLRGQEKDLPVGGRCVGLDGHQGLGRPPGPQQMLDIWACSQLLNEASKKKILQQAPPSRKGGQTYDGFISEATCLRPASKGPRNARPGLLPIGM